MPPITTPRPDGTGGGGAGTLDELLEDGRLIPIKDENGDIVGYLGVPDAAGTGRVILWEGTSQGDPGDSPADHPYLELNADSFAYLQGPDGLAEVLLLGPGGGGELFLYGAGESVVKLNAAGVELSSESHGNKLNLGDAGVTVTGPLIVPTEAPGTNNTRAASTAFVAAMATALINGAPAGGDTLGELDARLAVIEALGSLATDAELAANIATILGGVSIDADTLAELKALNDLRLVKANNLSDLANVGTALDNLGFTALFKNLRDDATMADFLTTLGMAANVRTMLAAADYAAVKTLLGVSAVTSLLPSSDTYIDSQAATTNYDTSTTLTVGDDWASSSFCRRALLTFDISTLASKTLQRCDLRLFTSGYGGDIGIHPIQARKVRRAYNPTQTTWNVYSTGNNWTTAGAKSTASDIEAEYFGAGIPTRAMVVGQELVLDLRTMVQAAIDAAETTLRIIVGPEETDSQNSVSFHSLESATTAYRPRLVAVG